MKTRQAQISVFALAALTIFLVSGCGATKSGGGASPSGASSLASTASAVPAGQAICGQDVANLSDLGINLKVFQDSAGTFHKDLVVIKFDRIPSQLSGNANSAFEIWSRTIDSSGNYGAYQQLSFYLQTTSGVSTPYAYTDLTWSQMQQIATYFGITVTTAGQFFTTINVVAQLTDLSSGTKIITPKVYDASSSYSPEVTALVPMYAANPNEFNQTNAAAAQALHPLQSIKAQALSTSQFQNATNQFCF